MMKWTVEISWGPFGNRVWHPVIENVDEATARKKFTDYEVAGLTNDPNVPKPFDLRLTHNGVVQLHVWHK